MEIVKTIKEMQKISDSIREKGKKIAFVPTMGYLHEGHASLITHAREYGDFIVTSIFVNPTQFAPNEDLGKYPRDFDRDKKIAETHNCDYLFFPDVTEMYESGYFTEISLKKVTEKFEGSKRPTHFNGVAIVVAKLFNIVKPHYALFGQKDYQQTLVIKQLTKDFCYDINIVVAPTVREEDGLALSSRNVYLTPEERSKAPILFNSMLLAKEEIMKGMKSRKMINAVLHNSLRRETLIRIDYASIAKSDDFDEPEEFKSGDRLVILLACYLGKTRLIDNYLVTVP
jgi:pantoate--beta-alanine ligase